MKALLFPSCRDASRLSNCVVEGVLTAGLGVGVEVWFTFG